MTAQPKTSMFKPGYEGVQPSPRLAPSERVDFHTRKDRLIRRLHDAMLTLSVLEDENPAGGGSSMPSYVHEFSDLVGRGEDGAAEETRPARFSAKPHHMTDLLPTLGLLDGLRPIYMKVLFLRAIGEFHGGFSFDLIGDRYGKSGQWAQNVYEAVVIQAARRDGLIGAEPRDHAVLVASVRSGGWRTFITTATDPAKQLRDLKAKSPLEVEEAFVIWTAGQPVAQRLLKAARAHLLGLQVHHAWHWISPDDMADLLITEARKIRAEWSQQVLIEGKDTSGLMRVEGGYDAIS